MKHSIFDRDNRVGARVQATFWIEVKGVAAKPTLVQGDISISGLYFQTDRSMGKVGSIVAIEIASADKDCRVEVTAHVVREVRCDDLYKGETVAGVALGFLLHNAMQQLELQIFLRTLCQKQESLQVSTGMEATAEHDQDREARVRVLSLDGMVIETDWAVEKGESLQLEVLAPASRTKVHLAGEVISCQRSVHADGTSMYSIQMGFSEATTLSAEESDVDGQQARAAKPTSALEPLLEEAVMAPGTDEARPMVHDLRGSLGQVGLPSILSFLEMERRSCRVNVEVAGEVSEIFMRDGQVVDVTTADEDPPRRVLEGLLDVDVGAFEISFREVDAPDRVATSTTNLLLEAARRSDEAARN